MAVGGVKLAWALVMFNVIIRICHAQSASGYCPWRSCGFNGVDIRYPFVLRDDALSGQCYTKYPNFDFQCVEKTLYLNFTGNSTYSTDTFKVTNIDYFNQTLSLAPYGPAATCRPFDASRFGGLNITNTTTLLLDCGTNIRGSCTAFSGSNISNPCNITDGAVNAPVGVRWACSMKLSNYTDPAYSSCYLLDTVPEIPNIVHATIALELQFAGNRTLSFINFSLPRAPSTSPAPAPIPVSNNSGRKRKVYIILGAVFGSLVAFVLFLLCMLCGRGRASHSKSSRKTERFRRKNIEAFEKMTDFTSPLSHRNHPMTTLYTLKELERATKSFSDDCKLGSGGFGTVFKGTLDNGVEVAIKRTNHTVDTKRISEQFMNEVTLLSQLNHRNLLRLHGCCLEVEIPMLVYEYVPNGDLFQHLQGERPGMQLSWEKRLQIAIDTAEALRYLHSSAVRPIYHRDVKTSNILVDDKFNVKVADFGISKLVEHGITHVSTVVQGTVGYLDPEYFENFRLTDKSDVFSFGMVLLELLTSLKPVDFQRGPEDVNLKAMALPFIQNGNIETIVDPGLFSEMEMEYSFDMLGEMQRVGELASKCLKDKGYGRPSMEEVVAELVAIRSVGNRAGYANEIEMVPYGADHKEIEMVLVPGNQLPSNVTSSTNSSSYTRYSNSPMASLNNP